MLELCIEDISILIHFKAQIVKIVIPGDGITETLDLFL